MSDPSEFDLLAAAFRQLTEFHGRNTSQKLSHWYSDTCTTWNVRFTPTGSKGS
jgi:hypothetical protein